jgi:biotin operon repressor
MRGLGRFGELEQINNKQERILSDMSIKAMNWVWEQGRAEGSDRLVLLALADFADDNGDCFGSWETMSRKTRLGRSTIARSVKRLKESGELIEIEQSRVVGGRNMATVWRIPVKGGCQAEKREVSEEDVGGVKLGPGGCQAGTPTQMNVTELKTTERQSPQAAPVAAAAQPPQDKQNPSLPLDSVKAKLKVVPKPDRPVAPATPLPHGPRFAHAWGEWVQFRKEIKKPMPPTTVAMQLKSLASLSEVDACDCIATSMRHGWTGLFPDKYKGQSSGKPQGKVMPLPDNDPFAEELAELRALRA